MRESVSLPIYHSAPQRAVRGRVLVLSALVPILKEGEELPTLSVSVAGAKTLLLMEEGDRAVFAEGIFAYFSVEIPCELTKEGDSLSYTLLVNGEAVSTYEVTYLRTASNADMPPLVFTELGARLRCKNGNVEKGVNFVEVMNPTDHPIDLYDYKLIRCDAEELSEKNPIMEVKITNEKGTVLLPGELAVLRFFPVEIQNDAPELNTPKAFAEGICELYPYPHTIDPASLHVISVVNSEYSEKKGRYVSLPDAFEPKIVRGKNPTVLGIARREEPPYRAFHTMTYGFNAVAGVLETPMNRSSVWGLDVNTPEKAVRISPAELLTPGELAFEQAYPDFTDEEAPAIAPLTVLPYYLSKGDMVMKLAVLDRCVTDVTLHVKDKDGSFRSFKAYNEGIEDVYEATVPFSFLSKLDRFEYYVTAKDSLRESALGSESYLYSRILYDNAGPTVLSCNPPRGYAIEGELFPEIRIAYEDRAGVNVLKSKIYLDGKDVSKKALWYDDRVIYRPVKPLSYGGHTILVCLYDLLGNKSSYRSDFSIVTGEELNCYRGEVHSHTMESDGALFPEQAMEFARDIGRADYFAVTEHAHYMSDEAYDRQKRIADLYDEPGRFAALYGYEMTWNRSCGFWGHMNLIGAKNIFQDRNKIGVPQIYEYLAQNPEAVAMFNHPGLSWGNFDEYTHQTPGAIRGVALSEIKGVGHDGEYALLLSKGWRAAPVYNGDNHGAAWANRRSTGYVLAPALTRENVMEAFRRRRTYTTSDKTLKIKYKVNGQWLGSTLKNPEELLVAVELSTENKIGIGRLQIVAEDNIVVAEEDIGARTSYHWELKLPALYDYYYVRILQEDHYTVTAPVWVEYENPLSIRHIRVFHDFSAKNPNDVSVRIDNSGNAAVKNIEVNFYMSGVNGFNEIGTKPYETVYLDKIKAEDSVCVTRRFPNISRRSRVTAVVRGTVNGKSVQCTSYVILSQLNITAVAPNTEPVTLQDGTTVENPFPYVQLFNTSNTTLNLSKAAMRLWKSTGKRPDENTTFPLKGVKIPPLESVVIWRRPKGSSLTVDDFNARYNTHLIEGKDIFVTELHVICDGKKEKMMRRIDVVDEEATLARVNYNMGVDCGKDSEIGNIIYYRYVPNMTGTATKLKVNTTHAPDHILDEQKARDFVYFDKRKEKKGEKHAKKRIEKEKKRSAAPKVTKASAATLALLSAAGAATATVALFRTFGRKKS